MNLLNKTVLAVSVLAVLSSVSNTEAETFSNVSQSALDSLQSTVKTNKDLSETISTNTGIIGRLNSRLKAVDGQSSVSGDNSGYAGTTLNDQVSSSTNLVNQAASTATNANNLANSANSKLAQIIAALNENRTYGAVAIGGGGWDVTRTYYTYKSKFYGSITLCPSVSMDWGSGHGRVYVYMNGSNILATGEFSGGWSGCVNRAVAPGTSFSVVGFTSSGDTGQMWLHAITYYQ